jgi:putative peptidoglycan lipid II flippase
VVNQVIASFLPSGSISYLYYADRLMELPIGVIGIALGTALLPLLSRQLAARQEAAAMNSMNRALELGFLLTLPAATALIAIPFTLVSVLFQRGAFGAMATQATAWALIAYASGLPAFVLIRVLTPGFYARHDTRTPVRFAVVTVIVNLALNVTLMFWLKHVGLALSLSLSTWLQAALLAITLHRRGHWRADARLISRAPRSLIAAVAMAGGVLLAQGWLEPFLLRPDTLRYAALVALVGAGGALYALLAQVTGAATLNEVLRQMRRAPEESPRQAG